jgi:N-acetylglucosaminyldiphosphoundecaprenol N-acetyl-beta-D-mannosaminyltransferase
LNKINDYCGKIRFRASTADQVAGELIEFRVRKNTLGAAVHFANAYTTALAEKSPELTAALSAGKCYPDGKPVVWFLNRGTAPQQFSQVQGPEVFEKALEAGQASGARHVMLGSTPGTLEKLKSTIADRFPHALVMEYISPPFRELTDEDLLTLLEPIHKHDPHIVWVGLGTPKQDLVAARLAALLPYQFVCVGAAFDFTAGNLRKAPALVSRLGLEWIYRWIQEPRRLWRRYLLGNSRFLRIIAIQALREFAAHR